MGGIGLRPWEIEELSKEDIRDYVRGYRSKMRLEHQVMMEAGRLAGFMAMAAYLPKSVKKPSQVVRFDWDGEGAAGGTIATMTEHTSEFRDWVVERDRKDIATGRLKPGTKGYEDAMRRINKADGNNNS
jgi:hypothetical protein